MGSGLPSLKTQWRLLVQEQSGFVTFHKANDKNLEPFDSEATRETVPEVDRFPISTDWRLRWGHFFKIFKF